MSRESFGTHLISLDNTFVEIRLAKFHPSKKRWTKVETYFFEITDNLCYPTFRVRQWGSKIWGIALSSYSLIPIMVRLCAFLKFDLFEPRVLSGGLVKMRVNADESIHQPCTAPNSLYLLVCQKNYA